MKRLFTIAALVVAAACGGSSSPAAPGGSSSTAVTGFVVSSQQLSMTANTVTFAWANAGTSTYKMMIGTTSGGVDVLNIDVTGTSYVWTAPRTAGIYYARVAAVTAGTTGSASTELPVFTLDLRNMIDAMYFGAGPMSQSPTLNPTPFNAQIPALIWADGSTISVLVTNEAGSASLSAAQRYVADYLAATGNHISVTVAATATTYTNALLSSLPENTVVVRVAQVCTQVGVIACANFGPAPGGTNRSFVNLNTSAGSISVAHEIGHSFGFSHVSVSTGARAEFAFLLNPALVGQQMTEAEKTVLTAARAGGMRANWTRAQALAAGLVLPYTGGVITPPSMLIPSAKDIESSIIR